MLPIKDRNNRKKGAPLFSFTHVVLLLLCAVLVTGHIISGIYAAYVTENQGGDTARVISFGDITLENDKDNNMTLLPGNDGKMQSYVTFAGSEAMTYVFVVITLPTDAWSYDGGILAAGNDDGKKNIQLKVNTDAWKYHTTANGKVVLYKALDPNTELTNVTVFADDGTVTVSTETTNAQLSAASGSMKVDAIAIQGNGFDDVEAAWKAASSKIS